MGPVVWAVMRRRWGTIAGLALILLGAGFQQLWLAVLGGVVFLADLGAARIGDYPPVVVLAQV